MDNWRNATAFGFAETGSFLTALFYPRRQGFREIVEHYIDFSQNEELQKEAVHMRGLGESILEEGREEGRQEGIRALVESCKEFGISKENIIEKLKEKFKLDEENAQIYIEKYWK